MLFPSAKIYCSSFVYSFYPVLGFYEIEAFFERCISFFALSIVCVMVVGPRFIEGPVLAAAMGPYANFDSHPLSGFRVIYGLVILFSAILVCIFHMYTSGRSSFPFEIVFSNDTC